MLLTTEEVEELTGLVKPSAQSNWLSRQKIVHFINAQNIVKVTWESVNNPRNEITIEPNWDNVA